jgi:hypothetical protein
MAFVPRRRHPVKSLVLLEYQENMQVVVVLDYLAWNAVNMRNILDVHWK